jgi:hypothetical protein
MEPCHTWHIVHLVSEGAGGGCSSRDGDGVCSVGVL